MCDKNAYRPIIAGRPIPVPPKTAEELLAEKQELDKVHKKVKKWIWERT